MPEKPVCSTGTSWLTACWHVIAVEHASLNVPHLVAFGYARLRPRDFVQFNNSV